MLGRRGSILLFLRGLPQDLSRKELKVFVQAALNAASDRRWLLKASVGKCSILRVTDPGKGVWELHGLVEVHPATAGMRAIEGLNGQTLKGARVEVRRYHPRSLLRDRRRGNDNRSDNEQRRQERRRSNLKIELIDA
ncbi:MAG: RNA-binding protein [Chromatiaceae bacterium]|jgi:hypothetical protein|nr:RNA-binding protein [Chromatiaceae bacterium]